MTDADRRAAIPVDSLIAMLVNLPRESSVVIGDGYLIVLGADGREMHRIHVISGSPRAVPKPGEIVV